MIQWCTWRWTKTAWTAIFTVHMLWMHTYVSEFAQLEMNGGKKQTKKDDILKINIDRKMTVMKCVNSNWMSMKRGKQILKSMLSPKMHKNQMKSTEIVPKHRVFQSLLQFEMWDCLLKTTFVVPMFFFFVASAKLNQHKVNNHEMCYQISKSFSNWFQWWKWAVLDI